LIIVQFKESLQDLFLQEIEKKINFYKDEQSFLFWVSLVGGLDHIIKHFLCCYYFFGINSFCGLEQFNHCEALLDAVRGCLASLHFLKI